jgi:hypothetical protein
VPRAATATPARTCTPWGGRGRGAASAAPRRTKTRARPGRACPCHPAPSRPTPHAPRPAWPHPAPACAGQGHVCRQQGRDRRRDPRAGGGQQRLHRAHPGVPAGAARDHAGGGRAAGLRRGHDGLPDRQGARGARGPLRLAHCSGGGEGRWAAWCARGAGVCLPLGQAPCAARAGPNQQEAPRRAMGDGAPPVAPSPAAQLVHARLGPTSPPHLCPALPPRRAAPRSTLASPPT